MSDLNWISAPNTAHHPKAILSKIRTFFDVEASSRSTHFCSVVKRRSRRYPMSLQTTLGLARDAIRLPERNAAVRLLIGVLRRWRKRARSNPQLCELNNCILQDIGPTRGALLRERPFWQ